MCRYTFTKLKNLKVKEEIIDILKKKALHSRIKKNCTIKQIRIYFKQMKLTYLRV